MVRPIDFLRSSSDNTGPIASSNVSVDELLVMVVQKSSQVSGRLERNERALISSLKFKPCKVSLVNTRLKVLIWEVVSSASLIFMLNNCQIKMSFDELNFFLYIDCNFSHRANVVVSLAMLK